MLVKAAYRLAIPRGNTFSGSKQIKLISKFVHAVDGNRRIKTKWLLWRGAQNCINALNEDGYSALHIACRRGHTSMVNLLLNEGADIHLMSMEECGNLQPLHFATLSGREDVILSLLIRQVNVNCLTENHQTALHLAVECNSPHVVELLLRHDAREDIPDLSGKTAYEVALERGYAAVINRILMSMNLTTLVKKLTKQNIRLQLEIARLKKPIPPFSYFDDNQTDHEELPLDIRWLDEIRVGFNKNKMKLEKLRNVVQKVWMRRMVQSCKAFIQWKDHMNIQQHVKTTTAKFERRASTIQIHEITKDSIAKIQHNELKVHLPDDRKSTIKIVPDLHVSAASRRHSTLSKQTTHTKRESTSILAPPPTSSNPKQRQSSSQHTKSPIDIHSRVACKQRLAITIVNTPFSEFEASSKAVKIPQVNPSKIHSTTKRMSMPKTPPPVPHIVRRPSRRYTMQ